MEKHPMKYIFLFLFLAGSVPAMAAALSLDSARAVWRFNPETGQIAGATGRKTSNHFLTGSVNHYYLMAKSGDRDVSESADRVVQTRSSDGRLEFDCRNPLLPELLITKKYWIENQGLRRELVFTNTGKETLFLTPATSLEFSPEFRKHSYYLGAGYIGPLIPAPQVKAPVPVANYYQTTKGMVLSNTSEQGSFAHYRLKLNDQFVFPWWQSTINTYREKPNILHYTPNGWSMALGTVDLPSGGQFRITDAMNYFPGNWYTFFEDVYGADPDVKKEIASIGPVPEWLQDVRLATMEKSEYAIRQLVSATNDGYIMVLLSRFVGDWADYRFAKDGARGFFGGNVTGEELRECIQRLKAISPRVKVALYNWVTSTNISTEILKEHPEWFKRFDRHGNESSLFPGCLDNFATMMNRPDCAEFMKNQLFDALQYLGADYIYLDEAKTTNFIRWQTDEAVRDDHWYNFWKSLKKRASAQNTALFFNARGNPFGDINYIEAYHQLEPRFWREFAGMGLGVETFLKLRPDARITPLYWTGKVDYANRLLALGWIPSMNDSVSQTLNNLAFVRAAYETGNSDPVDVRYTPDWKQDAATKIESYAIRRRHSSDLLMSFINRSGSTSGIPLNIQLATLGFPADARINIWSMNIASGNTTAHYNISDSELQENYRRDRWLGDFVTAPHLVYSGPASGCFRYTIPDLPDNRMNQLLITASPAGIYTIDSLGCNYFYTSRPGVRVQGTEVENQHENTELVLADSDFIFTNIKANGIPVKSRLVDIGGQLFPVITLGKGKFTLTMDRSPRHPVESVRLTAKLENGKIAVSGAPSGTLFALALDGCTLYTGTSPIPVPRRHAGGDYVIRIAGNPAQSVKLRLAPGPRTASAAGDHIKRYPEETRIEKIHVVSGPVTISAKATQLGKWVQTIPIQFKVPPRIVAADASKLRLQAGQTRRIADYLGGAFAGFELNGAKQVQLKLENSFYEASSMEVERHVVKYRRSPREFAGLLLDYRVNGAYAKRVALSVGVLSPKADNPAPAWGKKGKPDQYIDLGNLLDRGKEALLTLDLTKWAPKDWDGTVFLSIGTDYIKPDRRLVCTLLKFNAEAGTKFATGTDARTLLRDFQSPKTLEVPFARNKPQSVRKLTPAEWREWAEIRKFFIPGGTGIPRFATTAWMTYDQSRLYIAVKCMESRRKPVTGNANIWDDDGIELWFQRPANGQTVQLLVNAAGQLQVRDNGHILTDSGVDVKSRQTPGDSYYIFVSIPFQLLGWAPQDSGRSIRFNLCRVRQAGGGLPREYSTWGAVGVKFDDPAKFGILNFALPPEKAQVVNLGYPGHSSKELIAYQLPKLKQLKPELAVILIGTNDMLNAGKFSSLDQYEKNMRQMISALHKRKIQMLLVTLPPCSEELLFQRHPRDKYGKSTPNRRIEQANDRIRKIAAERKIPVADFYSAVQQSAPLDRKASLLCNPANSGKKDGVHPTPEGYAVLAEIIDQAIRKNNLPTGKIVCLGDSITYGVGVNGAGSNVGFCYPGQLAVRLKAENK